MKNVLFVVFWILGSVNGIANYESDLFCNASVRVGAECTEDYLFKLKDQTVGIVGNQSTRVGKVHLVDTLLTLGIKITKIFSPEHGFRGKADAGEKVKSGVDPKTKLPVISLYGSNKKPKSEQLKGIDVLIFDIQDVGARFYTYISTLHYVMEACVENDIKLMVLDRPNPNGGYVDGPVLDSEFKSFVGMHPVPVVHGLTIGEYACMINGEGWLPNHAKCNLDIIKCKGWDHNKYYKLPIKPSPNLPNMLSIYLYPSLCFFEGTVVSVGRGTKFPFQIIGHPLFKPGNFQFTPKPGAGSKEPKLKGKLCYGINFTKSDFLKVQHQKTIAIELVDKIL